MRNESPDANDAQNCHDLFMNENVNHTFAKALSKDATELFGATASAPFVSQVQLLVNKYRKKLPQRSHSNTALPVTERDALLITYGDQVKESNVAPLQTLTDVANQHLKGVVSGIHILPFFPWSSDDGFSVKDYFAIDPALGDWNDVREMGKHFDLMFDAVFNHMSAESEWFQNFLRDDPKFRDFFVTVDGEPDLTQVVRPRALPLLTEFQTSAGKKNVWTTFSADQVDLNFKNPDVLLVMLDALLFYVENGAKFIRLDAIAFLWKEIGTRCLHLPQTHRVIQLMRRVLSEVAPGAMLITETNVPHADNISYFGDGTNEAQLVYNFALPPLVLHSLGSGNAEKLTRWAQTLTLPSNRVTFFNFLASHDGIGVNPARGILSDEEIETLVARTLSHGGFISYKNNPDGTRSPYEMNINYFDALSSPTANEPIETQVSRFLCAQAIMLAIAGVPGIYFHSLFGSRGDRPGAETSGIPRRINRQKLTRVELENELSNGTSVRARVFGGLKTLLQTRASQPEFHPCSPQQLLEMDPRIFGVVRTNPATNEKIFCLHNVSNEQVVVSTQGKEFLGAAPSQTLAGTTKTGAEKNSLEIGPYQFVWIRGI